LSPRTHTLHVGEEAVLILSVYVQFLRQRELRDVIISWPHVANPVHQLRVLTRLLEAKVIAGHSEDLEEVTVYLVYQCIQT